MYTPKPLSPSRINQFRDCALLFRYRTIDQLPERPSTAAFRGQVVHLALEQMFDAPPAERTVENVIGLLPGALAELLAKDPETAAAVSDSMPWPVADAVLSNEAKSAFLDVANGLVRNYFEIEDPTLRTPADREVHVKTTLPNGTAVHGIIDRIEEHTDGRIFISDYKTGKSPHPNWQAKAWFQMNFYALLLWRERGVLASRLRLLYLGNTTMLERVPTETEMLDLEREVEIIAEQIKAAITTATFEPKKSKLCDWCPFQKHCPAQGGILLPLPESFTSR